MCVCGGGLLQHTIETDVNNYINLSIMDSTHRVPAHCQQLISMNGSFLIYVGCVYFQWQSVTISVTSKPC